MPGPVDDYFKQVKKDNPSYDDDQAWATAWSIYCKHKNPGSEHCHKPAGEYLEGKSAGLIVRVASRFIGGSWEGKLVGKDFRLSWNYNEWKLEELPQKGKMKLRVATRQTFLHIGSSSGLNSSPLIQENILKDGNVSASDSYDQVKAKIQNAFEAAVERVLKEGAENPKIGPEWVEKYMGYLRKAQWYEDQVHYLKVVPENVEPFEAKGKDFSVHVSWTEFSAYSPNSDLEQSDPSYTKIVSTAAASARKLYQTLKAAPQALSGISFDKFDEWLKKNKINYKFEFSVWR